MSDAAALQRVTRMLVPAGVATVAVVAGVGAASKLVDPRASVESALVGVGSNVLGVAIACAVTGIECALVVAIAIGALGGTRALAAGAMLLSSFCAWLVFVQARLGEDADCGCLSAFQRRTVSDALMANGVVLSELVVILGLAFVARRAAARDGRRSHAAT